MIDKLQHYNVIYMIIILDREEPDPRAVQRGANNKNMNMKQEGPFLGRSIIIIIM